MDLSTLIGYLLAWGALAYGAYHASHGALVAYGMTRGGLAGLGLALLGGGLAYHGATAHSRLYDSLGLRTDEPHNPHASIPAGHGVTNVCGGGGGATSEDDSRSVRPALRTSAPTPPVGR